MSYRPLVCRAGSVPSGIVSASGWRCLKLEGPFDFDVTGLVASFSDALARAGISIVVVCTYDTDYLLVRDKDLDRALSALDEGGYANRTPGESR